MRGGSSIEKRNCGKELRKRASAKSQTIRVEKTKLVERSIEDCLKA
jgi:hypothetical protein